MIPPIWFIELQRIENKNKNSTNLIEGLNLDIIHSSLNDLGLKNEELINVTTAVLKK